MEVVTPGKVFVDGPLDVIEAGRGLRIAAPSHDGVAHAAAKRRQWWALVYIEDLDEVDEHCLIMVFQNQRRCAQRFGFSPFLRRGCRLSSGRIENLSTSSSIALVSCAGTRAAAACRMAVASPRIGLGGRVLKVNAGVCRPATTNRAAAV